MMGELASSSRNSVRYLPPAGAVGEAVDQCDGGTPRMAIEMSGSLRPFFSS